MINFERPKYGVYDLQELIAILRAPGGCPWDAEQTHESIRRNFLEEAYEAVEAIDEKSTEHLKEELGDLLFSIVNVARFVGVDPEVALGKACDKFTNRFAYVESAAASQGKILADMTLDEMEALYQEGKSKE